MLFSAGSSHKHMIILLLVTTIFNLCENYRYFNLSVAYFDCTFEQWLQSKIEKVPMSIQGEKSRRDTASSGKLVSTIAALASAKKMDGTRCPEG